MKYLWASWTTKSSRETLVEEKRLKRVSDLAACAVTFSYTRVIWLPERITYTKPPGFFLSSLSRG